MQHLSGLRSHEHLRTAGVARWTRRRAVAAEIGGLRPSRPDTDAINGHRLTEDGSLRPEPTRLCTVPAAGGLWTTAADLVRLGCGWSSLLPDELVREALRPHAVPHEAGARMGLGWLLNQSKDVAGHPGSGPGAAASLITRPDLGQVGVALTNRLIPIESVNARLVRPIA